MPTTIVRGIATYYEIHGAGRPLVLLHNDGLDVGDRKSTRLNSSHT